MVKRIVLAILLLPLAEIAAFVLVATLVGVTPALLLLLVSTLAGLLVLRAAAISRASATPRPRRRAARLRVRRPWPAES